MCHAGWSAQLPLYRLDWCPVSRDFVRLFVCIRRHFAIFPVDPLRTSRSVRWSLWRVAHGTSTLRHFVQHRPIVGAIVRIIFYKEDMKNIRFQLFSKKYSLETCSLCVQCKWFPVVRQSDRVCSSPKTFALGCLHININKYARSRNTRTLKQAHIPHSVSLLLRLGYSRRWLR